MSTKHCPQCKQDLPTTAFTKVCGGKRPLVDGSTSQHEYRDEICRKCRREDRLAKGLCFCTRLLKVGSRQCEVCLEAARLRAGQRRREDRAAALSYYGEVCYYCGEDLEVFLTIDHINNDGADHRKRASKGKNQGHDIGAWLRKNKYPGGFQVLCVNCNHAKGRIGTEALILLLWGAGRLRTSALLGGIKLTEPDRYLICEGPYRLSDGSVMAIRTDALKSPHTVPEVL